jgi:hypothetical protein
MVIEAPVNLTYGTVTGKFIQTVLDQADVDRNPDYIPAVGTVTFKPDVTFYRNLALPAFFTTNTIQCTIDSNGDMRDAQGGLGVVLVATDNADLSPRDWTYTCTVSASGTVYSFPIRVNGGTTQDIAIISPVPSTPGVQVVVTSADRIAAQAAAASAAASAAAAAASAGGLTAGGIMNVHVNSAAAILLSKTADDIASTGRLAMTNAERTKLSGLTGWTTEQIQDLVGTFIVEGVGIDVNYDDTANTLTISNTGFGGVSTDAGNILTVGADGKTYLADDAFQDTGDYVVRTTLRGALYGWVLEAGETAAAVPGWLPVSTADNKTIIARKL